MYRSVSQDVTDVGKIYSHCYMDTESQTLWDLSCRNLVFNMAKLQDCSNIYMIQRRTDTVEKLTFYEDHYVEQDGDHSERDVAGENGDICVVELSISLGETGLMCFNDYYDTQEYQETSSSSRG